MINRGLYLFGQYGIPEPRKANKKQISSRYFYVHLINNKRLIDMNRKITFRRLLLIIILLCVCHACEEYTTDSKYTEYDVSHSSGANSHNSGFHYKYITTNYYGSFGNRYYYIANGDTLGMTFRIETDSSIAKMEYYFDEALIASNHDSIDRKKIDIFNIINNKTGGDIYGVLRVYTQQGTYIVKKDTFTVVSQKPFLNINRIYPEELHNNVDNLFIVSVDFYPNIFEVVSNTLSIDGESVDSSFTNPSVLKYKPNNLAVGNYRTAVTTTIKSDKTNRGTITITNYKNISLSK